MACVALHAQLLLQDAVAVEVTSCLVVLFCPAGALLGNMNYSKGVTLKCHHEKDALVWEALVSLPWQPCYKYK
jgi:hypothetical protein